MEERLANQRSDIYNQPDAHDPELVQRPTEEAKRPQRHASVYDAVAGKHDPNPGFSIRISTNS